MKNTKENRALFTFIGWATIENKWFQDVRGNKWEKGSRIGMNRSRIHFPNKSKNIDVNCNTNGYELFIIVPKKTKLVYVFFSKAFHEPSHCWDWVIEDDWPPLPGDTWSTSSTRWAGNSRKCCIPWFQSGTHLGGVWLAQCHVSRPCSMMPPKMLPRHVQFACPGTLASAGTPRTDCAA